VSYCVWAFETKELARSDLPYYELSIVPMLAAFLRYALMLDTGHGSAPEEVFGNDRMLQVLGLVWTIVFGIAVYT
jgi:decaprenyl-phosphate phosphoribosyltransferase